jgi:hypothetical protein
VTVPPTVNRTTSGLKMSFCTLTVALAVGTSAVAVNVTGEPPTPEADAWTA